MLIESGFFRGSLVHKDGKIIIEEDENGDYVFFKSSATEFVQPTPPTFRKAFVACGYWFNEGSSKSFKMTEEQGNCFKEVMRIFGGRIGQHIVELMKSQNKGGHGDLDDELFKTENEAIRIE